MSDLSQLARQLGDTELSKPLPSETYQELLWCIHVIGRAQDAMMASMRSLVARGVPVDQKAFERAFWALQAVDGTLSPVVLADAVAKLKLAGV
jgi:hypothetical protein